MSILPRFGDPVLDAFCRELVEGQTPIPVRLEPMLGEQERECFGIVEEQVVQAGGERVLGWAVWHHGYFIEAEFHAVWRRPDGEWLDLTPRPFSLQSIVFLPDPHAKYEGRQIDNVRKPLVPDVDLFEFLALCVRRFEILNEGDLAFQHGSIALSAVRSQEFLRLEARADHLEAILARRYPRGAD